MIHRFRCLGNSGNMAFSPLGYLVNCFRQTRTLLAVIIIIGVYHLFMMSPAPAAPCDCNRDSMASPNVLASRDVIPGASPALLTKPRPHHPETQAPKAEAALQPAAQTAAQPKVARVCPPHKRALPGHYKITGFTDHVHPPKCTADMEACGLNEDRAKISPRPRPSRNESGSRVQDLVTLTIKTRHRYLEVTEFINSIYNFYEKLPVVVLDEFNPHMDDEAGKKWSQFLSNTPSVTHVQARPGVGYGRQLAVRLSVTPYVIVADDDYIFTEKTNLDKLLKVMEETDADVVAGATSDKFPFAGAIRIAPLDNANVKRPHLSLYPGIFHDRLPCFENCYVADIVKTFFMARRDVILAAGSWDASRPFYEHEDFFFQMRKARLKVAYCDDVIVNHVARTRTLAGLRHQHFDELKASLEIKWKLSDYYLCKAPESYLTQYLCPEKQRKHFR